MASEAQPQSISLDEFRKLFEAQPQPQPTMRQVARGFGNLLQRLRAKRGLSLRDLEQLSGVPNPVISAIEHGRRRCGARVAKKLAEALVPGDHVEKVRHEFLYAAAATIKARGAIEDAQLYPPAVLDLVASKLRGMGIRDREILGAYGETRGEDGCQRDLLLVLSNGRRLGVRVDIVEEEQAPKFSVAER